MDKSDRRFDMPLYVSRAKCGCIGGVASVDPRVARDFLNDEAEEGRTVELTTCGVAMNEPTFMACPHGNLSQGAKS